MSDQPANYYIIEIKKREQTAKNQEKRIYVLEQEYQDLREEHINLQEVSYFDNLLKTVLELSDFRKGSQRLVDKEEAY